MVKRSKDEEALQTLARIRNLPVDDEYILREFGSIRTSFQMEVEGTQGMGWKGIVKEAFSKGNNVYRLYIAFMA